MTIELKHSRFADVKQTDKPPSAYVLFFPSFSPLRSNAPPGIDRQEISDSADIQTKSIWKFEECYFKRWVHAALLSYVGEKRNEKRVMGYGIIQSI